MLLQRSLRRLAYWPPASNMRSAIVPLSEKKSAFVFNQKSDVTGELEPSLCITLADQGERLISFTAEELRELEKLGPRLSSYMELWEEKKQIQKDLAQPMIGDLRD